ncbi:MAG: serine acetyltransferase [Lachnospiraceae bacterium]|nr:serine acetyltransferase [Lachnospiraceae bacterium]
MNEHIKIDLVRYSGKCNYLIFIKTFLTNSTFRFQDVHRLCNQKGLKKIFGNVMWVFNSKKKHLQIPRNTKIGYGLYIGHGGPVVINPTAIIGNNVNLSQFVTIGSNHGKAAIIGDNTYIGPNVCIVENVIIGDNVTIGAGSVVTKNIPDNATAVGNYAKVINYDNPGRYIKNKCKVSE